VASLQALRTMQSAAWAGAPPAAVDPSSVLSPAVLNAVRELMRFADTAYVSLASLQWVPVGQLPATHPETGIPVPGDRILYSMTNPNKVIAGVAERYCDFFSFLLQCAILKLKSLFPLAFAGTSRWCCHSWSF
jgi:hypothetical protein